MNSEDLRQAPREHGESSQLSETLVASDLSLGIAEYGRFWRAPRAFDVKPHHLAFVVSLATKCLALFNNWLVIRLALPSIGSAEFGVFASIIALTSVLATFDLGVGTTLVNVAAALKASSSTHTRRDLREALDAALSYCAVAAVVLPLAVWLVLELGRNGSFALSVPTVSNGTIWVCAAYAALFIAANAIQKLFAGLQLIWLGYGLALVGGLVTTLVLNAIAYTSTATVPALLAAVLLPAPLMALGGVAVWFAANPQLRPSRPARPRLELGLTDGFGIYLCQTGSILIYSAPVWVAASLSGPTNAGVVFALTRLVAPWGLVASLYTQPLWPEYTRLLAIDDWRRLERMVVRSVAVTVLVGGLGLLVTLAFGSSILALLHVSASLVQLVAALIWTVLLTVRQCFMAPVFASGRVRLPAIAFVAAVPLICAGALFGPALSPEWLFAGFGVIEVLLLTAHVVAYRALRVSRS